jgi:hypothetical protein
MPYARICLNWPHSRDTKSESPPETTPEVTKAIKAATLPNHRLSVERLASDLISDGTIDKLSGQAVNHVGHELRFDFRPLQTEQKLNNEQIAIDFNSSIRSNDPSLTYQVSSSLTNLASRLDEAIDYDGKGRRKHMMTYRPNETS